MIESSIARRYAKALLKIGQEDGKLEGYREQLNGFVSVYESLPELAYYLENRFADLAERLKLIDKISAHCGFDEILQNFLKVLLEKGRISLIGAIGKAYQQFVYELTGKQSAVIVSAKDLGDAFYREIETALTDISGREVILEKTIDPAVIGGVSIHMGEEIFDGTIKSHLWRLSENLRKTQL